jgi:aminoglycoside phosphotransferase (APT) family kinase protein
MSHTRNLSLPPVAHTLDQDTLIACAEAEDIPVDLTETRLHMGWQNAVLETLDGWILRFPISTNHDFARELRVLETMHDRLPAEIPLIQWTGTKTRFAAYRTLTGIPLDPTEYLAASAYERDRISESMATFLVQMHTSLSPAEITRLGIATLTSAHLIDEVDRRWEHVPAEYRQEVGALREQFRERWVTSPGNEARLLHNDFHLGNMVFNGRFGQLQAVWDFSCVEVGDPSYDLRYLFEDSFPLAVQISQHYEQLTGLQLDMSGAMLAGHFESVSDALVEGRDLGKVLLKWSQLPPHI